MSEHVVIFRARQRAPVADDYGPTVLRLKEKALRDYGCLEFVYATTPDEEEVVLTYWPDEDAIARWRADEEHRVAQRDEARWFMSYRVQVGALIRDYGRTR